MAKKERPSATSNPAPYIKATQGILKMETIQTTETRTRKATDLANAPETNFELCISVVFDDEGKASKIKGVPNGDFTGLRALSKGQFEDPCEYYSWRQEQLTYEFNVQMKDLEGRKEEAELMKTPEGQARAEFKSINRKLQKMADNMGMTIEELRQTMGA